MSPEARALLREFNREIEREAAWKKVKAFVHRWAWVPYALLLTWCLYMVTR